MSLAISPDHDDLCTGFVYLCSRGSPQASSEQHLAVMPLPRWLMVEAATSIEDLEDANVSAPPGRNSCRAHKPNRDPCGPRSGTFREPTDQAVDRRTTTIS